MNLNKYIDHTILKAYATQKDVEKICNEAIIHNFMAVCINPCHVKYANELLSGSEVRVCTVIGFPLGANTKEVKAYEAKVAIEEGADEIDMVINIGALKDKNYELVKEDIYAVREVSEGKILKVIIETCYLEEDEIIKACELAMLAGADFVKTSTGFGTGGAKTQDIKLMRECVGEELGVKASGGVKTKEDALLMIENGATRIGTSNGIDIIKYENRNMESNINNLKNEMQYKIFNALMNDTIPLEDRKNMIIDVIPEFKECDECNHEHPAHCYFVLDHIMHVVDEMPNKLIPRLAALFHDVAKPECKIKGEEYYHFWGHPEKGAIKTKEILTRLGYSDEEVEVVSAMVKYHDTYIDSSDELFYQAVNEIGKENIDDFKKLQRADLNAHSKWYIEKYTDRLSGAHEHYGELLKTI